MSDKKGPWEQHSRSKERHFPLGLLLWVALLLAVGGGIWALFVSFPGRMSPREYDYLYVVGLVAMLAMVSSGLIFMRRINLGEVIRNISIWTGLAVVLLLGFTYRSELTGIYYRVIGELVPGQAIILEGNTIILSVSRDGHFYANGKANGKKLRFMIDTGASDVVLSPVDASRIGIDVEKLQFTKTYQTANGIGLGAPYRLNSLAIGSLEFANVPVSVNKSHMVTSLLGMSFLERLQSFEFRGSKLYLRP
jgi:aspartyl protease family protein